MTVVRSRQHLLLYAMLSIRLCWPSRLRPLAEGQRLRLGVVSCMVAAYRVGPRTSCGCGAGGAFWPRSITPLPAPKRARRPPSSSLRRSRLPRLLRALLLSAVHSSLMASQQIGSPRLMDADGGRVWLSFSSRMQCRFVSVLGNEAGAGHAGARKLPVRAVAQPGFRRGASQDSLRTGPRALPRPRRLSSSPRRHSTLWPCRDIAGWTAAFTSVGRPPIIVPTRRGKRAPLLLGQSGLFPNGRTGVRCRRPRT